MKLRRNCREVTRIVLLGQDRPLALGERLLLRLHWLGCEGCSRFRDQMALMQRSMERWRAYRDGGSDEPGTP